MAWRNLLLITSATAIPASFLPGKQVCWLGFQPQLPGSSGFRLPPMSFFSPSTTWSLSLAGPGTTGFCLEAFTAFHHSSGQGCLDFLLQIIGQLESLGSLHPLLGWPCTWSVQGKFS